MLLYSTPGGAVQCHGRRGYDTREDAGDIGGEHEPSFGIDEPSALRRILRWIDERPAGQPFLVSYLPIAGHHPYNTPGAKLPLRARVSWL